MLGVMRVEIRGMGYNSTVLLFRNYNHCLKSILVLFYDMIPGTFLFQTGTTAMVTAISLCDDGPPTLLRPPSVTSEFSI